MPKISETGGPTDESRPDYHDLGASEQSPNVVANEDNPSEAAYTDAMSRHGTDEFTAEDASLVEKYQAGRRDQADAEIDEAEHRGEARDYSEYSYPELQQLCRDRELPATGNTEALVERLQENDTEKDA